MSEEPTVACSQKVICNPQTSTASTGGSHAERIDRRANALRSRMRCWAVRSCGSRATERASNANVKQAQTAEKRLRASGMSLAGSKRNGDVANQ